MANWKEKDFDPANKTYTYWLMVHGEWVKLTRTNLVTIPFDETLHSTHAPALRYGPLTEHYDTDDFLLVDLINRSISLLPEEQQDAFRLRYYDDLSYHEISDRSQCSLETAKVRVFFAVRRLRDLLQHIVKDF